jgi:tetratricopeptide (TPR) repeat protein
VRVFRGEYGEARIAVERFRQVAYRIGDPAIIFAAERRMGETLLTIGRPDEARLCFERILQHPVSPANLQRTIFYQLDDRALSRAMMARALCLLGFMERARREAQASLDELHGTAHQLSFCRVIYYGMCRIALMTRDLATAEQAVKRFIEVVTGLNAPFWHLVGRFLEGKLMVERRDFARGVEVLCDAFETCRRTGWRASYPEFMGALAEGLAGIGRLGDALDAVNDAIANAGEGANGQVWYVPELLRIKGELLLRRVEDQSTSAAEDCFNEAAEMAREQGALLWELRVALSLARVRVTQGRQRDARRQLASAYDRFTEGFETADLRAARAMLDALPS